MSAIRRRARTFLGLPALDDPVGMRRQRVVPWLAAPVACVLALAVWAAAGAGLESALDGRDNWQINAPAIAGLTAILLLAPSSPTQARARNAWVAAVVGLAVVGAGFGVASAGHDPESAYGARAFAIATAGALAGCVGFTALTRVERWTVAAPSAPAERLSRGADGPAAETAGGAGAEPAGGAGAGSAGEAGAGSADDGDGAAA